MIVECEKCNARFNLDESLLKNKGTKVQCSLCKDIFMVYQEKPAVPKDAGPAEIAREGVGEGRKEPDYFEDLSQEDFEKAFEEAEDEDTIEASLIDEVSEEEFEIEQALEREDKEAFEVEEEAEEAVDDRVIKPRQVVHPKGKPRSSGPFLVILLIILILLGGSAAVYFMAPQLIPNSFTLFKIKTDQTGEMIDPGASRLSFKGVTGSFLLSTKAGQLFVIKGMVVNEYSKDRSYILVKGTILDNKGQVVKGKMAYAGNTIPEEEINGMTLEQINDQLKNRSGRGNINLNVGPNRAIPFMIILGNLPENLSEFTVEAVSSSPGKNR